MKHRRKFMLSWLWVFLFLFIFFQGSPCSGSTLPNLCLTREYAERTKAVVISQIGVRETGQNRGEVEKYQRATGNRAGDPYCYSGIFWAFEQSKECEQNPLFKTGLASLGRRKLEVKLCGEKPTTEIGLLFWQFTGSAFGHVDFVFKRLSGGWVRCVAFNSGANARDGGGVIVVNRNIRHPLGRMKFKTLIYLA